MSPMFKPTGEDYYAYASSADINGVAMSVHTSKGRDEVSVLRADGVTFLKLNFSADVARALAAELLAAAGAVGAMGVNHG